MGVRLPRDDLQLTAMSNQAAPPFAIGARANTKAKKSFTPKIDFFQTNTCARTEFIITFLTYFRKKRKNWLSIISLSDLYLNYNGCVCVYTYMSPCVVGVYALPSLTLRMLVCPYNLML